MRKLLSALFLLMLSYTVYGQYPVNSTLGSPKATVLTKGIHATDSAFWLRTNFPDTGTANLGRIDEVPGSIIRVWDKVYMRSYNALKWIELSSGNGTIPTLQQVLTAGNVLTQDNHITGQNRSFYFDSLYFFRVASNYNPIYGSSSFTVAQSGIFMGHGASSFMFQNSRMTVNGNNSVLDFAPSHGYYSTVMSNGTKSSYFRMYNDSIYYATDKLVLNIPSKGVNKFLKSDAIGNASWADFPTDTSGWGLVGNSIDAAANFIGTTNNAAFRVRTNNTLTAVFDSLSGQLRLVNGTDPMLSLEQAITGQKWRLRNGVGTGLSNSSFNIYDATAGKIRFIINQDGDVAIGNVSSIPTVSQLYIYGGGSGANIDARGDSTNVQRDEANIEVEHPDYDGSSFNANGVAMQVNGNVTTGTFMGYPKKNSGQLRFTNKTNIIVVKNNASLRFGTNNTERMVLDSLGRLGIGVLSANAALHVYNQDSGEPTAIFDAHEDRPGTIIEARHTGVKVSALDTYGAVEVIDNSSQPTTPASGYSKIYSRLDSLRYMNDAGNEFTLGSVKYDTCTLATFSAGAGLSTDTAAFQTTSIYGSFYNDGNDTLIITKQMSILQGSSPSITPTVYWNDSLNVTAGAFKLVNSPSALTNTATGTAITSFDNYKIPPGVWVWVATPTVGTKPTYFSLSLIGYKKRI